MTPMQRLKRVFAIDPNAARSRPAPSAVARCESSPASKIRMSLLQSLSTLVHARQPQLPSRERLRSIQRSLPRDTRPGSCRKRLPGATLRPLQEYPPLRAAFPSAAPTATSSTGSSHAADDLRQALLQPIVHRNHPVSSGHSSYPPRDFRQIVIRTPQVRAGAGDWRGSTVRNIPLAITATEIDPVQIPPRAPRARFERPDPIPVDCYSVDSGLYM